MTSEVKSPVAAPRTLTAFTRSMRAGGAPIHTVSNPRGAHHHCHRPRRRPSRCRSPVLGPSRGSTTRRAWSFSEAPRPMVVWSASRPGLQATARPGSSGPTDPRPRGSSTPTSSQMIACWGSWLAEGLHLLRPLVPIPRRSTTASPALRTDQGRRTTSASGRSPRAASRRERHSCESEP